MAGKRKRVSKETNSATEPGSKRTKNAGSATTTTAGVIPSKPTAPEEIEKTPFVETPLGDERKREAYLYDFLSSEDVTERINAADVIVSSLLGDECVPEVVLLRHLEQRLFRGLASGRKASRLGFSLVLTEVLSQLFGEKDLAATQYPELSFDKVLGILLEKTEAGVNLPGLEERDHYFGQLFGLESFVSAGILFQDKSRWAQVLDLLVKMSQRKVWLRRQCGWIILRAIPNMKKKMVEKTLQKLADEGLAQTSEGVAIWLHAMQHFPKMALPAKPWQDPLSPSAFATLPAILKDSGRDNTIGETPEAQRKQSNWTAQLHFVWDVIVGSFAKRAETSQDDAAKLFGQFWSRVVDDGFFSKNASEAQKFSGFMIFQHMLESAHGLPFIVDTVFSRHLMACLMNQSAKEDRYLHRAAVKALKAIETAVEKQPSLLEPMLRQLLGNHGAYNFDQRTSSKTVEKILQQTTTDNAQDVLAILVLDDPAKSGLEHSKYVQALGNYLFKLASLPVSTDGEASGPSVAATALESLAKFTYSTTLPENMRDTLRQRATSAFAKFAQRPEDIKHLCNIVLSLEPADAAPEAVELARKKATKRLRKLVKATKKSAAVSQALALLYAITILQFYNEDPDALELFGALEKCYSKLDDDNSEDGETEFDVEILLSMVAQPSSLMRQVSQQVFDVFTPLISAKGIEDLTYPLSVEENQKGLDELFGSAEDGEEVEEGDEDIMDLDDLGSDVDIAELLAAGAEASGDEDADAGVDEDGDASGFDSASDSDEKEGDDESDGEANNEELQALGAALDQVLNNRSNKQRKAAAGDVDDSASDLSDMTDSGMMALEDKLAAVFRERAKQTSRRKTRRDAKETVIHFKHRILDLVAIFARKEAAAANPLALAVLLPLLRLVRTTATKALAARAHEILLGFAKGLRKAREGSGVPEAEPDALLALLREIHAEAGEDASQAYAKAASAASLAVVSVLGAVAVERTEEVFQLYAATQLGWYRKEVKVHMAFFQEWLNWCQSHASAP